MLLEQKHRASQTCSSGFTRRGVFRSYPPRILAAAVCLSCVALARAATPDIPPPAACRGGPASRLSMAPGDRLNLPSRRITIRRVLPRSRSVCMAGPFQNQKVSRQYTASTRIAVAQEHIETRAPQPAVPRSCYDASRLRVPRRGSSRRFFPRQAPFFPRLSACFSMWLGSNQSPSSDRGRSWTRSCGHRAGLSAFGR